MAGRFIPEEEPQTTLFTLGRYVYRAWVTNIDLTPVGVWHFYDGRAIPDPRLEGWVLRKERNGEKSTAEAPSLPRETGRVLKTVLALISFQKVSNWNSAVGLKIR